MVNFQTNARTSSVMHRPASQVALVTSTVGNGRGASGEEHAAAAVAPKTRILTPKERRVTGFSLCSHPLESLFASIRFVKYCVLATVTKRNGDGGLQSAQSRKESALVGENRIGKMSPFGSQYRGTDGSTVTLHASIPPFKLRTCAKPAALRISSAFIERTPWWQCVTISA